MTLERFAGSHLESHSSESEHPLLSFICNTGKEAAQTVKDMIVEHPYASAAIGLGATLGLLALTRGKVPGFGQSAADTGLLSEIKTASMSGRLVPQTARGAKIEYLAQAATKTPGAELECFIKGGIPGRTLTVLERANTGFVYTKDGIHGIQTNFGFFQPTQIDQAASEAMRARFLAAKIPSGPMATVRTMVDPLLERSMNTPSKPFLVSVPFKFDKPHTAGFTHLFGELEKRYYSW